MTWTWVDECRSLATRWVPNRNLVPHKMALMPPSFLRNRKSISPCTIKLTFPFDRCHQTSQPRHIYRYILSDSTYRTSLGYISFLMIIIWTTGLFMQHQISKVLIISFLVCTGFFTAHAKDAPKPILSDLQITQLGYKEESTLPSELKGHRPLNRAL